MKENHRPVKWDLNNIPDEVRVPNGPCDDRNNIAYYGNQRDPFQLKCMISRAKGNYIMAADKTREMIKAAEEDNAPYYIKMHFTQILLDGRKVIKKMLVEKDNTIEKLLDTMYTACRIDRKWCYLQFRHEQTQKTFPGLYRFIDVVQELDCQDSWPRFEVQMMKTNAYLAVERRMKENEQFREEGMESDGNGEEVGADTGAEEYEEVEYKVSEAELAVGRALLEQAKAKEALGGGANEVAAEPVEPAQEPAQEAAGSSEPVREAAGSLERAREATRSTEPAREATGSSEPSGEADGILDPAVEMKKIPAETLEAANAARALMGAEKTGRDVSRTELIAEITFLKQAIINLEEEEYMKPYEEMDEFAEDKELEEAKDTGAPEEEAEEPIEQMDIEAEHRNMEEAIEAEAREEEAVEPIEEMDIDAEHQKLEEAIAAGALGGGAVEAVEEMDIEAEHRKLEEAIAAGALGGGAVEPIQEVDIEDEHRKLEEAIAAGARGGGAVEPVEEMDIDAEHRKLEAAIAAGALGGGAVEAVEEMDIEAEHQKLEEAIAAGALGGGAVEAVEEMDIPAEHDKLDAVIAAVAVGGGGRAEEAAVEAVKEEDGPVEAVEGLDLEAEVVKEEIAAGAPEKRKRGKRRVSKAELDAEYELLLQKMDEEQLRAAEISAKERAMRRKQPIFEPTHFYTISENEPVMKGKVKIEEELDKLPYELEISLVTTVQPAVIRPIKQETPDPDDPTTSETAAEPVDVKKPEILKEKKKKFGDDFSDRRLPMAHHPLMDKEARLGDLPVEDKIVLLKQELTADRISVFIHNYSFGTGADTFIWNFEPNFSHPNLNQVNTIIAIREYKILCVVEGGVVSTFLNKYYDYEKFPARGTELNRDDALLYHSRKACNEAGVALPKLNVLQQLALFFCRIGVHGETESDWERMYKLLNWAIPEKGFPQIWWDGLRPPRNSPDD